MLQRSPTWIGALPGRDKVADTLRARLPATLAHRIIRSKNILFMLGFYTYCRRFPDRARTLLLGLATRRLRDPDLVAEHFTPTYDPWDQRFCAVPDADLFKVIRSGDAEVVTDHVERFVPEGIQLRSGRVLEADLVVTATGLQLLPFGGIAPRSTGRPWTCTSSSSGRAPCSPGCPTSRSASATPTPRGRCAPTSPTGWCAGCSTTCPATTWPPRCPRRAASSRSGPLLDLSSGYIQRSIDEFPRQGNRVPWRVRQNYLVDSVTTLHHRLESSMDFVPRSAVRRSAGDSVPA